MTSIAVIIPYYQKRAGILRRALNSVLQQRLPPEALVEVIVTDDGSPIPVESEIDGLAFQTPFSLTIKKQANAGVGAARNTSLNSVAPDTTYIAFLDSDDVWKPEHLATAIAALDRGYDFYFCDSQRSTDQLSKFAESAFEQYLDQHAAYLGNSLYQLDNKTFFDKAFRGRMFHTPTVVYRRSIAPQLRLDASMRISGEDCLFFFTLLQARCRACCSTQQNVSCMEGVNEFAGRGGWNNPANLGVHMSQLLAYRRFGERLALSPEIVRFNNWRIRKVRALFAFLTVRSFVKFRTSWSNEVVTLIHDDRSFWLWYPFYTAYVFVAYPLRLYDPSAKWWAK